MRRHLALKAAFIAALLLAARPTLAQQTELRIVRPIDVLALPLVVMQHEHLIERTADSMGLGAVHVTWSTPGDKTSPLQALAAGKADLAMAGLVPLLIAEDAADGQKAPVSALAAIAARPFILVTRNPAIHTIIDFTKKDRIAVPAVPMSQQALLLEMAAAQEWGSAHYRRLDPLMVARPDKAADDALYSGKGEVDAHFSQSPWADDELASDKIHRVMDSYDIVGPQTVAVLAAATRLDDKPELLKAVLAALQAADDFIGKHRGESAEYLAGMSKGEEISVEDLTDMIGAPDLVYNAAPKGVVRLAEFMHRTGRLKRDPKAWQDLFLPEARDLKGS